jgi:hypothetical protein
MKYLIFYLSIIGIVFSKKTWNDPVARHDTSQCSNFLCPKHQELFELYLQEGCINSFEEFLKIKISTSKISQSNEQDHSKNF